MAAVSEGRLLPLYHRRSGGDDNHNHLRFHVRPLAAIVNNLLHGQHYGNHHCGWVWNSNAGCLIDSAAAAVLPRAFPGGRLSPVPPRPMIVGDGRLRVKQSLHQIWLFLAVATLLCFLLS